MSERSNNQVLLDIILEQDFSEHSDYSKINDFFEFFSAQQMFKKFDLNDEEIERGIIGSGGDGGIDSAYLFYNGLLMTEDRIEEIKPVTDSRIEFFILQSKNTFSYKESTLMKWKSSSKKLFQMGEDLTKHKEVYRASSINLSPR